MDTPHPGNRVLGKAPPGAAVAKPELSAAGAGQQGPLIDQRGWGERRGLAEARAAIGSAMSASAS